MINVGKKILSHRQTCKLTIRELAEKTGLSTAIISQLERNIGNPSLRVLSAIAGAMGMKVSELVAEEPEEKSLILRKKDRQQTYNPDEKYIIYNLLTPPNMNANLTMNMVHCEPHSETYGGEFHAHLGEEVVYVLRGNVSIVFEDTQFALGEGDTLRVPPQYKHQYINTSNEAAEMLTIKARGSL